MINLFQPQLGSEEIQEITKVFESNWIGKGRKVEEFENGFSNSLGVNRQHFFSTTSCTEGLYLAADLFQFNSNDEVIVPVVSFPSVASAVEDSGAKIVFCDVDSRSLNVRAEDIKKVLTSKTKAVFVTHYGGVPCEMDAIMALCRDNNVYVIEDAACSVRSFYKDRACGTIGDMGVWSFDAMKTLSTGDGGMIYIKDLELFNVAKERLYLGLPQKQKSGLDSSSEDNSNWWEFEMNRTGRRAIMNDITAAIGCSQLIKLDSFLERRKEIFGQYMDGLKSVKGLALPPLPDPETISSFYFFWVQSEVRDGLAKFLLDNGVYSTFRYWPLHKVKYFRKYAVTDFPNGDVLADATLNIPIHQALTNDEVFKIINLIKRYFEER